ncbi:MAG: nicotinate-nucleotide adenylyltransferase [Hyphomicrobium sp.]|nr:nicotinate-nucleotide adenylyltransferase [Hyphomicrobium sp.]
MRPSPRTFGAIRVKTPVAPPRSRIGLMGGSFNPPHEGHLRVAETALKRLDLDQLWWIVTPGNPLKSRDGLPPLAERMAACRRLAPHPRMTMTGFEAELGSPYTAVTLGYLKRRFPDVLFVWVMGADNLAGFHRWQNWRAIAGLMPIAVVDRPGWRLRALAGRMALTLANARVPEARAGALPQTKPPSWTFLTARLSDQSSTALRRQTTEI